MDGRTDEWTDGWTGGRARDGPKMVNAGFVSDQLKAAAAAKQAEIDKLLAVLQQVQIQEQQRASQMAASSTSQDDQLKAEVARLAAALAMERKRVMDLSQEGASLKQQQAVATRPATITALPSADASSSPPHITQASGGAGQAEGGSAPGRAVSASDLIFPGGEKGPSTHGSVGAGQATRASGPGSAVSAPTTVLVPPPGCARCPAKAKQIEELMNQLADAEQKLNDALMNTHLAEVNYQEEQERVARRDQRIAELEAQVQEGAGEDDHEGLADGEPRGRAASRSERKVRLSKSPTSTVSLRGHHPISSQRLNRAHKYACT